MRVGQGSFLQVAMEHCGQRCVAGGPSWGLHPPLPRVLSRLPSARPPLPTALRSAPRPLMGSGDRAGTRGCGIEGRGQLRLPPPTGGLELLSERALHLSLRVQNFVPLLPVGVNMMVPTAAQIHRGRGRPQLLPQTSGFPGVPGRTRGGWFPWLPLPGSWGGGGTPVCTQPAEGWAPAMAQPVPAPPAASPGLPGVVMCMAAPGRALPGKAVAAVL